MQGEENRLMDAILSYTEQEVRYRINNPLNHHSDTYAHDLKIQFYQTILDRFKGQLSGPEKTTRAYIKDELRKLTGQRGELARWIIKFFSGNLKSVNNLRAIVHQQQNKVGLEQNLTNLTEAVKKAGFTQNIDHVLQKMMNQGLHKFHIRYTDIRHPNTDFILHFSHIEGSGAYKFDKFDVSARPLLHQTNTERMWYGFPQHMETLVSASEAVKLVNDGAICKNEQKNEWIVLNKATLSFNTVEFDMNQALKKMNLPRMGASEYKNLLTTLKNGNSKEITLHINGRPGTVHISAAPIQGAIKISDGKQSFYDINTFKQHKEAQTARLSNIFDATENTQRQGTKKRH